MKLNWKNITLILLILISVNTVQIYLLHTVREFGDINFFKFSAHVYSFIYGILSLASVALAWRLLAKFGKRKRALLTLFLSLAFFAVFSSVFFFVLRTFINGLSISFDLLVGNFVYSFFTSHIFISAYTVAYLYFVYSRNLEDNVEKLEQEKLQLNSNLLKQNLEPHFLFNNLSVLKGLIRKDPGKADDFMDSFSEVYRYYLKHNAEEREKFAEELHFLENYLQLMKTRFGNAYQCEIEVENEDGYVLPCAVQLSVENAVKHNAATDLNPLVITVNRENEYIVISNEIRKQQFVKSNGMGNDYLKRRYEILFGKEIKTFETEGLFIVKIPVI